MADTQTITSREEDCIRYNKTRRGTTNLKGLRFDSSTKTTAKGTDQRGPIKNSNPQKKPEESETGDRK